jgi:hypothetical protein
MSGLETLEDSKNWLERETKNTRFSKVANNHSVLLNLKQKAEEIYVKWEQICITLNKQLEDIPEENKESLERSIQRYENEFIVATNNLKKQLESEPVNYGKRKCPHGLPEPTTSDSDSEPGRM